jgi:flagellar motor switch protein FliN/FliY
MNGRGREVVKAIVNELVVVLGGLLNAPATLAAGAAPDGAHWSAEISCAGVLRGRVTFAFDAAGIEALTRATPAGGEAADAVSGLLREALTQAISTVESQAISTGVLWKLDDLSRRDTAPAAGPTESWEVSAAPLGAPLRLALFGCPEPSEGEAADVPSDDERPESRIDVILDIDLPVVVRFGRTELPIRMLTQLGPGSVLDLGRSPDDPVELLVSDRIVAHGEVVIVGGNYGIRIVDVVSPSERVRTMEA